MSGQFEQTSESAVDPLGQLDRNNATSAVLDELQFDRQAPVRDPANSDQLPAEFTGVAPTITGLDGMEGAAAQRQRTELVLNGQPGPPAEPDLRVDNLGDTGIGGGWGLRNNLFEAGRQTELTEKDIAAVSALGRDVHAVANVFVSHDMTAPAIPAKLGESLVPPPVSEPTKWPPGAKFSEHGGFNALEFKATINGVEYSVLARYDKDTNASKGVQLVDNTRGVRGEYRADGTLDSDFQRFEGGYTSRHYGQSGQVRYMEATYSQRGPAGTIVESSDTFDADGKLTRRFLTADALTAGRKDSTFRALESYELRDGEPSYSIRIQKDADTVYEGSPTSIDRGKISRR